MLFYGPLPDYLTSLLVEGALIELKLVIYLFVLPPARFSL
jgi:hypothetical protein